MGKFFDSPWAIIIIIALALLLFGAPKLPGMARSVGQSLRIFKSEVKQMKDDADPREASEHPEPVDGRELNARAYAPDRAGDRDHGGLDDPQPAPNQDP